MLYSPSDFGREIDSRFSPSGRKETLKEHN